MTAEATGPAASVTGTSTVLESPVLDALGACSTGALSDGLRRLGHVPRWLAGMRPGNSPPIDHRCWIGQAFIIEWARSDGPPDHAPTVYDLMRGRQHERALVLAGGDLNSYLLGENVVMAASVEGFQLVVVDGYIRDADSISRLPAVGVFSLGVSGRYAPSSKALIMRRDAEVAGQPVRAGDVIAADGDGVLVFAADIATDLVVQATDLMALERRQAELIQERAPIDRLLPILEAKRRPATKPPDSPGSS